MCSFSLSKGVTVEGCLSTQQCFISPQSFVQFKGVRKRGGFGVKNPTFSLIFYEKFITCAKEINCFRILFAC